MDFKPPGRQLTLVDIQGEAFSFDVKDVTIWEWDYEFIDGGHTVYLYVELTDDTVVNCEFIYLKNFFDSPSHFFTATLIDIGVASILDPLKHLEKLNMNRTESFDDMEFWNG